MNNTNHTTPNNNHHNNNTTSSPHNNNNTSTPSTTLPSMRKMITVKKRQSNRRGNYILGETIGKGAFAKVKLATHIQTQEKVAIKILDKQKLLTNELNINNDIIRIKKEINILKQLRHKNIIQLYEIMETQTTLYIVMEYCEGKELFDYIIKRKHLNEREACRFFQQIINGVEYLHLMNVTHRDLKPENLLLDSKKRIKISDFGLSTISQDDNSLLQTPCGTPSYAPPEMLRGDEYNGALSDVWSCGIILYTMLCGNLPCAESKEELIYQTIMTHNYDFPSYVSPGAIDLINNMLMVNPNNRYSFAQIKNHPWFNLVEPQLKPGLLVGIQHIPIDEEVLNQVEKGGYDKEECRLSILENKYDALTAFYYLRLKQMSREGKSSVSDLFSEEYVKYISNKTNWENPEMINNEKYKDYFNYNNCGIHNNNGFIKVNNHNGSNNYNYHNIRVLRYNEALASTGMAVNKKLFNVNNKTYVKKKEPVILKLSSDMLQYELKTQIVSSLNKSCENFKYQLDLIDNIDSLPLRHNSNSVSHFSGNNIISLIAEKLIMSSVFGKYITHHSIINNNNTSSSHLDDELVDKFYMMQKYKNLVEIIKSKQSNIFPKKIYNWNFNDFEDYLNDEDDFVFSENFLRNNNMLFNFIQKNLRSIKNIKPNNNNTNNNSNNNNGLKLHNSSTKNEKVGLNVLYSERISNKIYNNNKHKSTNNSSALNNSAYYKRTKQYNIGSCSVKKKTQHNNILSLSTYVKDNTNNQDELNKTSSTQIQEKSNNKLNVYAYNNKNYNYNYNKYNFNTNLDKHNKITSYNSLTSNKSGNYIPKNKRNNNIINKFINTNNNTNNSYNKQINTTFKFKISSSTMNDISEDEELFCNINSTPLGEGPFTERHSHNTTINAAKEVNKSRSNNNTKQNDSPIHTNLLVLVTEDNDDSKKHNDINTIKHNLQMNKQNGSSHTKTIANFNNNVDVSYIHCNHNYYCGPIDFRCIITCKINEMICNMKSFFKKMDYFFNVKNNKIKCSKANLHIEIEITKIKEYVNQYSELNYLKIKLKSGETISYNKIINEMLLAIF